MILVFTGIIKYDIGGHKNGKASYFLFIFVVISFTTGLSYRLGSDIIGYSNEYYEYSSLTNIHSLSYFTSFDDRMPLWVFVNSFFRTLGCDFYVLHLFQVLAINLSIYTVLRKYTNCSFFSLLFYLVTVFLMYNYEIMREALAVSVFLYSTKYLVKSKYLQYFIFCFIAIGFHMSALITLIIPIFRYIISFKYGLIFIVAICFIILLGSRYVSNQLLILIEVEMLKDKAISYFSKDRYSTSVLGIGSLFNIAFNVLLPFLLYIQYLRKNNERMKEIFWGVACYGIVHCLSLVIPIFYRFNNYFYIFFIIYLIDIATLRFYIGNVKAKSIKGLVFLILFVFSFGKFYAICTAKVGDSSYLSYKRYYPYSSIFTEERDFQREKIIE